MYRRKEPVRPRQLLPTPLILLRVPIAWATSGALVKLHLPSSYDGLPVGLRAVAIDCGLILDVFHWSRLHWFLSHSHCPGLEVVHARCQLDEGFPGSVISLDHNRCSDDRVCPRVVEKKPVWERLQLLQKSTLIFRPAKKVLAR